MRHHVRNAIFLTHEILEINFHQLKKKTRNREGGAPAAPAVHWRTISIAVSWSLRAFHAPRAGFAGEPDGDFGSPSVLCRDSGGERGNFPADDSFRMLW